MCGLLNNGHNESYFLVQAIGVSRVILAVDAYQLLSVKSVKSVNLTLYN